jgi:predicted nucleic acid-binding protein
MSLDSPTHLEIYDALAALRGRLDAGSERFVEIDKKLDEIVEALKPLPQMQADIAATKDIVEAWSAIKTIGKFVKWAAGLIAAMAIIVGGTLAALKIAIHLGD